MLNENLNLSPKSKQIQNMFDKISRRYDFLNRLLSCGQDQRWRNQLVASLPAIPDKDGVLYDVACGTGDVIFAIRKKRKDYKHFKGFDISKGMLSQAELRDRTRSAHFIQASAEHLPAESESADCLTIAFGLRNVDNRMQALREFHRVLKPNAALLVLEFFPARSSFLQKLFHFYFQHILPKIGGLLSDKDAYAYLPRSVETMPSTKEFEQQLAVCGFHTIQSNGWLSGSTMLFKCFKK